MRHIVPVSGGKDSTALAFSLQQKEPRDYDYLITPTGNELPETISFWDELEFMLGKPLIRATNKTLDFWIREFNSLPNWRQRWCTRLLKIEPCLAWVRSQTEPVTLYVGLRADEELRSGIYSNDVITDFPFRRWGWNLSDVQEYLRKIKISVPWRNDCALCFGQRLHEWKRTLREHPDMYRQGEEYEFLTGHTFRSPGRDSMPAALVQLRAQIDRGKVFKQDQTDLFSQEHEPCRVCSL